MDERSENKCIRYTTTDEKLKESLPHLDIDQIWRIVGKFGRYQVRQISLVSFFTLAAGWHLLSYVFLGYEPNHVCSGPDNISDFVDHGVNISSDTVVSLEKCSIIFSDRNESNPETYEKLSCVYGNNYSMPTSTSALSEWDYVCGKRDLGQIPQSAMLAGQGVGALLTFMADYFGRRKTLIFSQIGIFVASFSVAFVDNFWLFTCLRLITGAFQQGCVLSSWIYMVELVPAELRSLAVALFIFSFAVSYFALTAISYILRYHTWRTLAITLSFSSLHAIFVFFFMEESLRWLIVNNKTEQAVRVLKKICSQNRTDQEQILRADIRTEKCAQGEPDLMAQTFSEQSTCYTTFSDVVGEKSEQDSSAAAEKLLKASTVAPVGGTSASSRRPVAREGFAAFLKDPKLLCQSSVIWFAWFVNVLVYFGLILVPFMAVSNRFLQFTINAVMEILTGPFLWLTATKLKRRTACIMIHLIGGIGLTSSTILFSLEGIKDDWYILIVILAFIGEMSMKLSFIFLFLYTPELFPTNLRNTGIGVASFCGRFGGIIAPFTLTLANRVHWAPGAVFGTCCLLVSFLVRFVPETGDKELPQKTRDIKTWEEKV